MRNILIFLVLCFSTVHSQMNHKVKTINVFVALLDNMMQGIVPVSDVLGDGQNPKTNLY